MDIKQIITVGVAETEVLGNQYGIACGCRSAWAARVAQTNRR